MYNIERFIKAQDEGGTYATAFKEIQNGKKQSHWIWFIFPQMKGLGKSSTSDFYGIESLEEAKEYLKNDILRFRLENITKELLKHTGNKTAWDIFGSDAKKVRSSMTLFDIVEPEHLWGQVLDKFFGGKRCDRTISNTQKEQ